MNGFCSIVSLKILNFFFLFRCNRKTLFFKMKAIFSNLRSFVQQPSSSLTGSAGSDGFHEVVSSPDIAVTNPIVADPMDSSYMVMVSYCPPLASVSLPRAVSPIPSPSPPRVSPMVSVDEHVGSQVGVDSETTGSRHPRKFYRSLKS